MSLRLLAAGIGLTGLMGATPHVHLHTGLMAQAVTSADGASAWLCPMHPDVTSDAGGRCTRCGMALIEGHPFDTREYDLEMAAVPAAITPGVPFRLTLRVTAPDSPTAVTDYAVVHDKRYHLFVISEDMQSFQHLHPDLGADGTWSIDLSVPEAGYYRVLSDFVPVGAAPQFLGRTLVTAGFRGDLTSQASSLVPDTVLSKTVGTLKADVTFEPPVLRAGDFGHLVFALSDVPSGRPVTDLQPYLGAFGHTLILSEDMADAVHSHPAEWVGDGATPSSSGGPRITFEGYMPQAGRYRAWSQFLRDGVLTTFSFTFAVHTLDEVMGMERLGLVEVVPGRPVVVGDVR